MERYAWKAVVKDGMKDEYVRRHNEIWPELVKVLKEAGIGIESCRAGCYIDYREFEDAELRMLIDGVLSSKHITAARSKDLIERICGLSNKYFKTSIKHIHSVNDWSKTDNNALFYNIESIYKAIEKQIQIRYDYNKYGIDR